MSDTAEDLNAAHTAEQWFEQDIRQAYTTLGLSEEMAWGARMSGLGMDYVLARAHYELETLNNGDEQIA